MKITQQMLADLRHRAQAYQSRWESETVRAWLRTQGKPEMEKILAQADQIMEHTFVFDDLWDMEPCRTPYTLQPIRWQETPNGDPEWVFMLNRHEYMKKLVLAQLYTGDDRYLEELKRLLFHWMEHNPISCAPGPSTRTIDTGIRCASWLPLILHLTAEGRLTEEALSELLQNVEEQFRYLKKSYVPKYTLSNWGVLQTSALCQWSLWLGPWMDEDLREWAASLLKEQLGLQIYADGSHWEQSILYHMEVLNTCSNVCILAPLLGQTQEQWLLETMAKMYRYVQMAMGPDGYQQAQGDSDRVDVRDVMVRGALLLGDGGMKHCGFAQVNLDNLWLFGGSSIRRYDALPAETPAECCGLFPHSGNYYFRTGWDRDACYTYLKNGALGSSHGHVDLGHLSVYCQGKPILVDSGRYTYLEEDPLREKLKKASAHNVCVVEGSGEGTPHGSWSYDSFGDCLKNYVYSLDKIHYAELPFLSRSSGGSLCFHSRRVFVFPEGLWLTIDDVRMDGPHKSRLYYHLAPEVEIDPPGMPSETIALRREGLRLVLGGGTPWNWETDLLSERYNELSRHWVLTSEKEWTGESYMDSWLIPEGWTIRRAEVTQSEKDRPCTEQEALAWEILEGDVLRYVVVVFLHEVCKGRKVFLYRDKGFYGKAVVLKKEGETLKTLRLRV